MSITLSPPDNELTIVKSRLVRLTAADSAPSTSQFERIQGPALAALLSACRSGPANALDVKIVLLLDLMLRVIAEPPLVSTLSFATSRFTALQRLFYGALGSNTFVSGTYATRQAWAYQFGQIIKKLSTITSVATLNHHQRTTANILPEYIEEYNRTPLDTAQVSKLQPFYLTSKSGHQYQVVLAPMLDALGHDFTTSFYAGVSTIARAKAKDSALRDFCNTFALFINNQVTENKLQNIKQLHDQNYIQTFLVEFMEFHFLKITRRTTPVQEGTLPSLQKLWSRYRSYWNLLVKYGLWVAPSGAFPEGNPKLLNHSEIAHRRIIVTEDGSSKLVTQKLLVSVPLHITDNEATKILFEDLERNFSKLSNWLREYLENFFKTFDCEFSIDVPNNEIPNPDELRTLLKNTSDTKQGIELAAWYLHKRYNGFIDTNKYATPLYPNKAARDGPSKTAIAARLCIPSLREALALMGFLISEDGRCTEAALAGCTLYDKTGNRINAVETDGGLSLSVLKERTKSDGWQNVTFNGQAAEFIRKWILATAPLRSYMKEHHMAGWRYLFIYTGTPLGTPRNIPRGTNLNNHFKVFALTAKEQLGDLTESISLPRIRATRGVLVFLRSMDLAAMARELGNTQGTSLRHYLPDSLWEYFSTRWLRIFQNLLIVEATKDTPYMTKALQFNTPEEMDEFLRNHAVQSLIPESNITQDAPKSEIDELMVPASTWLFSTLLSISAATDRVIQKGLKVTPQALYWHEFTKRIRAHILSNQFHDRGIKTMMLKAEQNINSANFEEVVCG